MENKIGFLTDSDGKASSTRALSIFIIVAIMFAWGVACVFKQTLLPFDDSHLMLMLIALIPKLAAKIIEAYSMKH